MIGIAVAAIVLLAVVGFLAWRAMTGPLYTPGMVRSGKNLRGPLGPPAQQGDEHYWHVEEDIRLYHDTQGTGRPILVVHGGPGYPIHRPLAGLEPLANDFQVSYYDQRGCGKSTRPFDRFESSNFYTNMKELERTLGIGAQLADIERIRRILGQEKLILMGHSFGAFLATMYAAEFPEHVDALVLVAPAGVLVLPDESGGGFFEEIRSRLPDDKQSEYDRFLKEYLAFGSVFKKSEAELAKMNRQIGEYFLIAAGRSGELGEDPPADNGGWMVQAMYFSMGKRHDYRQALRNVQAPALIVHGENDVIPERVSRMYADHLPAGRLHVIKNSRTLGGHVPFSDQPEVFAAAVREFLTEKR
ncbi:MAG: alpha/beta hydrolase [Pirellulales bacterium]